MGHGQKNGSFFRCPHWLGLGWARLGPGPDTPFRSSIAGHPSTALPGVLSGNGIGSGILGSPSCFPKKAS